MAKKKITKVYCSSCGQEKKYVVGHYFDTNTGKPIKTWQCENPNCLCRGNVCESSPNKYHKFGFFSEKCKYCGYNPGW